MSDVVLDASALLAALNNEPGGADVADLLGRAAMSTVNWSEVVQKVVAQGIAATSSDVRADVEALGVELHPFSAAHAERAAALWPSTRPLGLSLGDRACLALAVELGIPAVTTDRVWARLSLPVEVRLVR